MISKELQQKLFSQDSLFKPFHRYPANHWLNINRRVWTSDELEELWFEHMGHFDFNMIKPLLLVLPFNEKEITPLLQHEVKNSKLICGKVIKIGQLAFDAISFPFGATCTYNDWITFDLKSADAIDLNSKKFFLVEDRQVMGVITDPKLIINNKENQNDRTHSISN